MKKTLSRFFKDNKTSSKITPIILVVVLIIIGFISFSPSTKKSISKDKAITVSQDFINSYLMEPGTRASVINISEEYGLYKLEVDIVNGVVESYLSKDGKLFFPQALNIEEVNEESAGTANVPAAEVSNKSDKPVVELFIMSHCPYGTQMMKGIAPALKALGNDIDFQLKFNDYSMRPAQEISEQMNQYCIEQEQSDLLLGYWDCFLVDGDGETCLATAGIDTNKLNTCLTRVENEYNIISDYQNNIGFSGSFPAFSIFKDDNEKYGVKGSPTLVINGQTVGPNRDPASILYTICSAFNTQPDACFSVLPTETPAPGFGLETTANSTLAEC